MKDFDENTEFRLSPKGIAFLSMHDLGLIDETNETKFHAFWDLFEARMLKNGYVSKEGE